MKFKTWDKKDLIGTWNFYIKIDGVRCHKKPEGYYSRANKQLHNIPEDLEFEVAEIYCGDFKTTIENTRTFTKKMVILKEDVYELLPNIDKRLCIGNYDNPTAEFIHNMFKKIHSLGHEGLILHNEETNIRLKVKSEETCDVKVIGIFEGKGRNKGKLGGFITEKGRVGSGLNDIDRELYFTENMIDKTIEVKCMELTPAGMFRQPIFVRLREDK
jgi:hypothetical protein